MGRLKKFASAAAFVGVAAASGPTASAQSAPALRSLPSPELQSARALPTSIIGVVNDERGGPVAGALISAIGTTIATTLTDENGRFRLEKLPPGDYVVRAHLSGFAASRRELVQVGPNVPRVYRLQIRRLDAPPAPPSRSIVQAGFGAAGGDAPSTTASADDPAGTEHPHTETAWRLRHIKRSILKNTADSVVTTTDTPDALSGSLSVVAQPAAGSTLFGDLPFSGEVNLLTTGFFGPAGGMPADRGLPRGVAYLSIGAPTPAGNWSVRAAMSEGDIASWIVAGAFVSRESKYHTYNVGLSYTSQDYQGGNPMALAALKEGSRNVGEVYGLDRWTLSPGFTFEYGGRYARYDYLTDQGLFSPRVGLTLEPVKGTRVTAVVARREIAPGAEEFLASGAEGPWLPPERTFAPFPGDSLQVERARYLDVIVEHEFSETYAIGIRRFFQDVDDQLVTLFGLNFRDEPRSVGHYYVASAGTVNANGWGVRLSTPSVGRVRGSIDYTLTRARWVTRPEANDQNGWSGSLARADNEDIHDITTAIHTDIPETATRVYVLYKLNSAYSRGGEALAPGLDGRFDVQVNQALPFGLAGTQWEALFGLRNLFRDANDPASVYDELLVVRPPKRVVGGFLVRF